MWPERFQARTVWGRVAEETSAKGSVQTAQQGGAPPSADHPPMLSKQPRSQLALGSPITAALSPKQVTLTCPPFLKVTNLFQECLIHLKVSRDKLCWFFADSSRHCAVSKLIADWMKLVFTYFLFYFLRISGTLCWYWYSSFTLDSQSIFSSRLCYHI